MKKYNIVLIVLDALRSMNLPMYGYSLDTTPFLNKFSREGTLFKNAYSTVDQTDPSFTTILSGRYPLVHGIIRHGPDLRREDISTFYRTGTKLLSQILSKKGYVTIAIDWLSRWHKEGYQYYGPVTSFKKPSFIWRSKATGLVTKILSKTNSWKTYELLYRFFYKLGFSHDRLAACVFDLATSLLKNIDKPFFLMIHLWDTHTPFNNIPKFLLKEFYSGECSETVEDMAKRIENDKWREIVLKYHLKGVKCVDEIEPRYNASIKYADYFIASFIDFLEENHIYEDTIFVITGDHGENLVRDNIFIGHGGLFQRVIKIPLIMAGPRIPRNKVVEEYVQHIDIVPTILDILDYDIGKYYFDGKSLLKTMETGEPPRDYVLAISSTARKRYALIKENYKLVYSPTIEDAYDKYGGIWFKEQIELYDLDRDIDDQNNLVNEYLDIVKDLEKELNNIIKKLVRMRMKLILRNR